MPLRRVVTGFATLALGTLLTQLIGFVALAVAARRLGPHELGAVTLALSISLYFSIPANFGVAILGIRDVAREPERAREIAGEVLVLRAVIGGVATLALVLLAPVLATDHDTRRLLPLAALTIIASSGGGEWMLLALQRSGAVAASRFIGQATYGVLVLATLSAGYAGARGYVLLTVMSLAITAAIAQTIAWRATGTPRLTGNRTVLRARLISSAPLGIVVAVVQIYLTTGSVMIGYLDSTAAVGQFAVAQKLPLALYGVVDLWSATLYPQVARLMISDRDRLRRQIEVFMMLSLAVALPLCVGGALTGHDLIPRLFGSAYRSADTAFALLLAALSIALLTVNLGSVLAAGGQERRYALAVSAGAVANVLVNFAAIPLFGIDGAAAATIAAEVAILVFVARRYRTVVGPLVLDLSRLARTAAAVGVMAAVLIALGSVNVFPRIVVGALAYAGAALALGVVTRAELGMLRAGRAV